MWRVNKALQQNSKWAMTCSVVDLVGCYIVTSGALVCVRHNYAFVFAAFLHSSLYGLLPDQPSPEVSICHPIVGQCSLLLPLNSCSVWCVPGGCHSQGCHGYHPYSVQLLEGSTVLSGTSPQSHHLTMSFTFLHDECIFAFIFKCVSKRYLISIFV